ncbi:RES family NAD+ phosphorylase [Tabrizicola oligotrophica]|uniref:RES family NAD+ phosphorylase n=1 Tax=Tabrizicola oligotrophica TaxID=2710650 RepID=UPI001D129CF2|nr:RES domain-containing protein [Tabrizicola oligotrophica]
MPVYRALNPVYARDPLSGAGAALHGGRFNRKGRAALYTALTPVGAVNEANQAGRPFEPVVLVAYDGQVGPCLDACDPTQLAAVGLAPADLAAPDWRLVMAAQGITPLQAACERLIALGYHGMIAPSYAEGAHSARNLVLWRWEGLSAIDHEGRLSR